MASREITSLSSAEERARAAEQLRAAQTEFKSAIQALPADATATDWNRLGQQIASKYDYVDFSIGSNPVQVEGGPLQVGLSTGEFFVKGYGTNAEFETYKSTTQSNRDDAYFSPGSSTTPTQALRDSTNNQAAREPSGGSASDAPGLGGSSTTPATGTNNSTSAYSSTSTDSTGGPSPANTVPVTQNGDAASTGGAGSSSYNAREDSGTASTNPNSTNAGDQSDDAGSSGGTGTGGNPGNSTGGSTDGSNNGSNNNGVSVGQLGQGSQLEDPSKKGTPQNKRIFQRPNALHSYVNWTYQVGWYMLEIPTFNSFSETGSDSASLRKKPIMRSGGFAKRNAGLDYDLNLVGLKMQSVIGNNSTSPGSNVYEIEMQVLEPYGISLIQQLKELAGSEDDPFHMPYLLEIKWLGYDDVGRMVNNIPETGPKLISVKIINITFDINSAGTIYTITMVPYSQTAIDSIDGVIRQDVQLYGDSLQTLLNDGPDSLKQFLIKKSKDLVRDGLAEHPDEYEFEIVSFDPGTRARNNKLARAPVTFPQKGGAATQLSRRGTGNPADIASGIAGTPGLNESLSSKSNDPNKQYFSFKGGTRIVAAIIAMAKNSKYFQDKVPDVPNGDKENPFELIKVVPVVSDLGKFDNLRKTYQKKVTYKIMSYFDYGRLFPYAGQAKVDKRGFIKEYNWIFTGKNDDIFDLRLDLNLMYYQIMTSAPVEKAALNAVVTPPPKSNTAAPIKASDTVYGIQFRAGPGDPNAKSPTTQNVSDAFDFALNSPKRADLIELDLQIIGDPDWITQDRSVRPKGGDINANNSGFVDNDYKMGVAVDVDSVYVKLLFRTPRDYDDEKGIMNVSLNRSFIEGVYKVVNIESRFQDGKFTQVLRLVRTDDLEENQPQAIAKTSSAREDTSMSRMADARQQDRLSVPGYLSPIENKGGLTITPSIPGMPGVPSDDGMTFGVGGLSG